MTRHFNHHILANLLTKDTTMTNLADLLYQDTEDHTDWSKAACADHYDLYDKADDEATGKGRPSKRARSIEGSATELCIKICDSCPIKTACLQRVGKVEDPRNRYSIWAGLDKATRSRLL